MNTEDQTTNAVFDPADFGIKEGQWWEGPRYIGEGGIPTRDLWQVLSAAPGRVRIKHSSRTKVVCPFVLAFTYDKAM